MIPANDTIRIEWRGTNRVAECRPDPRWPAGKPIDASEPGRPTCTVRLPYPAPCIGVHVVICEICGMRVGTTAAGRPDDPTSITFNCNRPAVPHG